MRLGDTFRSLLEKRRLGLSIIGVAALAAMLAAFFGLQGSTGASSATDLLRRGEAAYRQECASCHGPKGDRVPLAPLSARDFLDSRGDATLMAVIAQGKGTMPAFGTTRGGPFTDKDTRAVVAYLNQRAGRVSNSVQAEAGRQVFAGQCERCHGAGGERIPIAPLNAKGFLDMKTDAELRASIIDGKGVMPPFDKERGGKLSKAEVESVVAYLRYRVEEQTSQTAGRGRDFYVGNCLVCHGTEGNRIPKIELGSARYLQSLGDGKLTGAIAEGKGVMPAFGAGSGGSLGVPDVAALLIYLKTWAGVNATSALVATTPGAGRDLFVRNCTGCHGENGDRVAGVQLFSKEFLTRETDAVLLQTITRGNAQGMPAWGQEAGGPLTVEQIQSLLEHLKASAQTSTPNTSAAPAANANGASGSGVVSGVAVTAELVAQGRDIFGGTCAMCHGETRDKVATCRLTDRAFFSERGDAALINSITAGKGPMPAWGKEKGGPLSPDQVQAVLAYLKDAAGVRTNPASPTGGAAAATGADTASTASTPAITAEAVTKGKDLFTGRCVVCHGETRDKVPTCELANPAWLQQRGFDGIVKAVTAGKPPMMPTWGKEKGGPLSAEEIRNAVSYLWDAAGLNKR